MAHSNTLGIDQVLGAWSTEPHASPRKTRDNDSAGIPFGVVGEAIKGVAHVGGDFFKTQAESTKARAQAHAHQQDVYKAAMNKAETKEEREEILRRSEEAKAEHREEEDKGGLKTAVGFAFAVGAIALLCWRASA